MSKKWFCLSMVAVLVAASAYSEQERVIRVQNFLRFGYDDNIYLSGDATSSPEIIDVLNISGKFNFSSRTDAVFSWQPEIRYRSDGDPKTLVFQDLYGKLNHAISERVFLTLSDRFRYQQRDAQSGVVSRTDDNYMENDLMGALDFSLNSLSRVKLGGGYEFRIWDDDNYGELLGNNYDAYTADVSYLRDFNKGITVGMVGVTYNDTEYDGNRGGGDAVTLMGGADHTFSPEVFGFLRGGASFGSVDTVNGSEDTTTPYLNTGIDYNPSERTSISGNMGYSIYRSQNSLYNAQDRFNIGIGVRHDLTAKISIASTLAYIMSYYNAEYANFGLVSTVDGEDEYFTFNLRGSYQINRNNFIELGYEYTDRSINGGILDSFDRNRVDIGWRLRL